MKYLPGGVVDVTAIVSAGAGEELLCGLRWNSFYGEFLSTNEP